MIRGTTSVCRTLSSATSLGETIIQIAVPAAW